MDQIPHTQRIFFESNHQTDEGQFRTPRVKIIVETRFPTLSAYPLLSSGFQKEEVYALLPQLPGLSAEQRHNTYQHIVFALQKVTEMLIEKEVMRIHERQYSIAIEEAERLGLNCK